MWYASHYAVYYLIVVVSCVPGLIMWSAYSYSWWRHQMETFSVFTGHLCGEFTAKRPVTRRFDVSFDLLQNKRWVNNDEAGDLRRHRAYYDFTAMLFKTYYRRCGNRIIRFSASELNVIHIGKIAHYIIIKNPEPRADFLTCSVWHNWSIVVPCAKIQNYFTINAYRRLYQIYLWAIETTLWWPCWPF